MSPPYSQSPFPCQRVAPAPMSRRGFLASTGAGFGMLGLGALLGREPSLAANDATAVVEAPEADMFEAAGIAAE